MLAFFRGFADTLPPEVTAVVLMREFRVGWDELRHRIPSQVVAVMRDLLAAEAEGSKRGS